jgi:tetratricopeptide (TPR) repeat protein
MVLKAGPARLEAELADNLTLLVLLPPERRYSPAAAAFIVIAWDRQNRTLELLDGNGEIQTLPEADFFSRREPLKQAALCLARPGSLLRAEPPREQKLLLADFWYDQGNYRQPAPRMDWDAVTITRDQSVESLVNSGKALFRRQRYKESIPVFRAALAKDPDNPVVLNYLAYAMLNGNGELLTALRHANKANRLDANNPVVLETLACINLRLGDAQTAVQHLEHAWARALHRPPEMQVAIMDQLVRAWLAADRQDLARQVAEHRVRTFPEYALPKDILLNFPNLRRARFLSSKNIPVVGG